jgi:hypothetical protein
MSVTGDDDKILVGEVTGKEIKSPFGDWNSYLVFTQGADSQLQGSSLSSIWVDNWHSLQSNGVDSSVPPSSVAVVGTPGGRPADGPKDLGGYSLGHNLCNKTDIDPVESLPFIEPSTVGLNNQADKLAKCSLLSAIAGGLVMEGDFPFEVVKFKLLGKQVSQSPRQVLADWGYHAALELYDAKDIIWREDFHLVGRALELLCPATQRCIEYGLQNMSQTSAEIMCNSIIGAMVRICRNVNHAGHMTNIQRTSAAARILVAMGCFILQ